MMMKAKASSLNDFGKKVELFNNSTNLKLVYFKEPRLMFGFEQKTEDPRDGLILWGPHDKLHANNFNIGIIGEPNGINRLLRWLERIRKPMQSDNNDIARPFFPGFESTFEVGINFKSIQKIEIDPKAIDTYLKYTDKHQRVKHLVDLFTDELTKFKNEEEHINIQVWFIVIPDKIYLYGRPKSTIPIASDNIKDSLKKKERYQSFLFDEFNVLQEAYNYEPHFHNQLKARLLKHKIITQIIKESTIAYEEVSLLPKFRLDGIRKMDTDKAWNIATTLYYKACGRPWKLGDIREKVCYVGLVFKKDEKNINPKFACCAAQMFLDSGDGMVFKGDVGPWYSPENKQFHLDRDSAKNLLEKALKSFHDKTNNYPEEIFIHGKTYFDTNEWDGFIEACRNKSKVVGIRIRDDKQFKVYREFDYPVLRGLAYIIDNKSALLWTRGFIPRLQTIIGTETPNALSIEIVKGEAEIETVCKDVLALTKLNYNACKYSDGIPVTLRFADLIGEILTAAPLNEEEILPFQYYI